MARQSRNKALPPDLSKVVGKLADKSLDMVEAFVQGYVAIANDARATAALLPDAEARVLGGKADAALGMAEAMVAHVRRALTAPRPDWEAAAVAEAGVQFDLATAAAQKVLDARIHAPGRSAGRKRPATPKREAAARAIAALWPNGVPPQSELSNKQLCATVARRVGVEIGDNTILRAAGRKR